MQYVKFISIIVIFMVAVILNCYNNNECENVKTNKIVNNKIVNNKIVNNKIENKQKIKDEMNNLGMHHPPRNIAVFSKKIDKDYMKTPLMTTYLIDNNLEKNVKNEPTIVNSVEIHPKEDSCEIIWTVSEPIECSQIKYGINGKFDKIAKSNRINKGYLEWKSTIKNLKKNVLYEYCIYCNSCIETGTFEIN